MSARNISMRRGLFSAAAERQAVELHAADSFGSDDEASSPTAPVDVEETEASAPSDESVVADTAVTVVNEEDKKRKRDDEEEAPEEKPKALCANGNDEDVELLRLRKVHRSKADESTKSSENEVNLTSAAAKPKRNEASPSFASPSSMLSPMKDATKRRVTPRKARMPRKPQNLQSRLGETELTEKQVVKVSHGRQMLCVVAVWLTCVFLCFIILH